MSTNLAEGLRAGIQALGLNLSAEQQQRLLNYMALIQKWTKVYNLTAVRDPAEMLTHHMLDSLAVIKPLLQQVATLAKDANAGVRLLDVGSGAGLPGVVMLAAWKNSTFFCTAVSRSGLSASSSGVTQAAMNRLRMTQAACRICAVGRTRPSAPGRNGLPCRR